MSEQPRSLPQGASEVSRDTLVAVASIIDGSAAALALADLDARLEAGQDAAVYRYKGRYLVGPRQGGVAV